MLRNIFAQFLTPVPDTQFLTASAHGHCPQLSLTINKQAQEREEHFNTR